jgi:hypothetical protein
MSARVTRDEVNSVQFSPIRAESCLGLRITLFGCGQLRRASWHSSQSSAMASLCVRYSPSGDRIASGADSVQIWNAETGVGILSIRNSSVWSLAWTADGTHVIGGRWAKSRSGTRTTENNYARGRPTTGWIRGLSLSPTATHLVTSNWNEKPPSSSISQRASKLLRWSTTEMSKELPSPLQGSSLRRDAKTTNSTCGKPQHPKIPKPRSVLFLLHPRIDFFLNQLTAHLVARTTIFVIARRMQNLCTYHSKSLTSVQQRPAIPLAGPSRNDGRGLDPFWDSLPNVRIRSHSYIFNHEN